MQNAKMSKSKKKRASKDPVPLSIKPYYFGGRPIPNILSEYGAVGFDLDSFVRYDVNKVTQLIVSAHLNDLLTNFEGYPKEMEVFDW
jgi:hypothetical protein